MLEKHLNKKYILNIHFPADACLHGEEGYKFLLEFQKSSFTEPLDDEDSTLSKLSKGLPKKICFGLNFIQNILA